MVGMAEGILATAEVGGRPEKIEEAAVAAVASGTVETGAVAAAAAAGEAGLDQILATALLGGTGVNTSEDKCFFLYTWYCG